MPIFNKSEFAVEITDAEIRDFGYIGPGDCPTVPDCPPCPPSTDAEIRAMGYIKPSDCPEGPIDPPIDPPPETDLEKLAFNESEGDTMFDTKGMDLANWPTERLKQENKDDISNGKFIFLDCGVGQIRFFPMSIAGDITVTPEGFMDFKCTRQQDASYAHHHTMVEFQGNYPNGDPWENKYNPSTGGRSLPLNVWTKQSMKFVLPNFINDTQWKILSQYHWGRNPCGAITADDRTLDGGSGFNYPVRADSRPNADDSNYTRKDNYDMKVDTPRGETVTLIVESYIKFHHSKGSQRLIVNGNVIINEIDIGNNYNDSKTCSWGAGLYKYFNESNEPFNHIRLERALSQMVSGPRLI